MTEESLVGKTIKGYAIQSKVGSGGFGAVYRAYQELVKREVAIKVILPAYANDPDFIRRFEAEAQLIAHLEHLHIVPLYDYWRDYTGAYLVMRWFRGGSLADALQRGHWPIQDIVRIVDQVAAALVVAHRNNVIHRDLKPANILLDEERNAYLADFGIAQDLGKITDYATQLRSEEQQTEGLVGSPDYMSPEQIKQQELTPQSDLYNFGLVIYELLTGVPPYAGLPLSTLISKHLMEPLPHLHEHRPDLPETLQTVLDKATAKDPAERYEDALEMALAFRDAIEHTAQEALEELEMGTSRDFSLEELGLTDEFMTRDFTPINPYKGLRAFQEVDADDFYGRESLVDTLMERLQAGSLLSRFIALVGPSGSGKSSVVKAGLIPRLRRGALEGAQEWFIVEMVPGAHPLEELEAALLRIAVNPPASLQQQLKEDERGLIRAIKRTLPGGDESSEIVLFIDQFEEIFTLVEDEDERTHFLDSLAAAVRDENCKLRLVVTLRADFYDRPLYYAEFGQLMSECNLVVLPLSSEELHRAITDPAERVGLELEPGLVSEIILDVGEQPGTLPLLQYALTELFERRDGRHLTLHAYREIGGVSGALARRAEELYQELETQGQDIARQLFLRLVTLGEGSEDTRRRTLISELLSLGIESDAMQGVIDTFGKYRLLTFDRDPITRTPTVEVAHEALIRQWRRLQEWLDESRAELRLQRRLAHAAQEWETSGRDTSFLATGSRLEQFEEWQENTALSLSQLERDYYEASLAERAHQEELKAARKAKEEALERRSRNFLRALVAVLSIAFVIALGLTAFAFTQQQAALQSASTATVAQGEAVLQSDNASTQAAIASENEVEARNRAFISDSRLALANNDTDLALLLAMQANQIDSTAVSRNLLAEVAYYPGTRWLVDAHTDKVEAVTFTPEGELALTAARDSLVYVIDVETGEVVQRLEGHNDWVLDVAVSPDGTRALSASSDFTLILWNLETGEIIRRFEGHTAPVRAVDFNADGTQALSGSEDGTLVIWDVETGEMLRQSTAMSNLVYDVDWSESGFTALSAQGNGRDAGNVILWNVQSLEPLLIFDESMGGHTSEVWSVTYTNDEQGFVSGGEDRVIRLWTFEAGQPVLQYQGHSARVTSLDFSPDGRRLVSGSEDSSVIVWDARTGAIQRRFIGHSDLVYGVAFSPDGRRVLSGAWDSTVRLWDADFGAQLTQLGSADAMHGDEVHGAVFSPDGSIAATSALDGTIILWDMVTYEALRVLEHPGGVRAIAFSPDGAVLASGALDGTIRLWDVDSGDLLPQQLVGTGHTDEVWALAFHPDGTLLASGAKDNSIILWDLTTGEQVDRIFEHINNVSDIAFSPDGTTLVSSGFDFNLGLVLWDMSRGEMIQRLEGHTNWIWSVAFSPDGSQIVSGGADNTLILWDRETGRRLQTYRGHDSFVYDVAFSPDSRYLVSASADQSIFLWDVDSGELIQRITGHNDAVRGIAVHPDGTRLLSAAADGTARVWEARFTLEELQEWIEDNRYLREFTCGERERFGIEPPCATPTPVIEPGSGA